MRWLISVEPEIIQRPKADRIGVLILGERLAIPGYGIASLSHSPGRATISLAVERAVVWPARFLRRRMEVDVTDVNSGSQRHAKGLNRTIEIHIVHGVFVVPHPRRRIGYLVAHKPKPIVSRIGLELIYGGACPCRDSGLHPNRRQHWIETEGRVDPGHAKLAIGDVVIHVALVRMRLTPGVFTGSDICCLSKIG